MSKSEKIILMLLDKEFPTDVRVQREATALTEIGYHVIILCRNLRKEQSVDCIDGIEIRRLPIIKNVSQSLLKTLSKPVFFNPLYIIKAIDIVFNRQICAIHVHDLPLSLLGIALSKYLHIPSIIDFHEDYPAMIRAEKRKGLQNILFHKLKLLDRIEKWVLSFDCHFITVCPENTQRLHLIRKAKTSTLSLMNVVDLEEFITSNQQNLLKPPPFRILYTGILGYSRGLAVVISAIAKLPPKVREQLILQIVGDGKARTALEQLSYSLRLNDQIQFVGMVPREQLSIFVAQAHICIIPHEPNDHTNSTIPNKLFEFMALKKPVIVSNTVPMQNIVQQTQCGIIFDYHKPESFNSAIISLVNNDRLRRRLGENGFRSVQETYNWSKEKLKLIHFYDQIINKSIS